MQYNRNKPFDKRLLEAENQLQQVWSELSQLRERAAQSVRHRDIRWAITDGVVPSSYPNAAANTFPIIFLDAHFIETAGLRTFTEFPRSLDPVTFAHAATGQYIPAELPLPVFWQRGLGGEDKGEWWFLDPPRLYVVKLTTALTYRGSASAEIWLPDATFELVASGITITVHDVGLLPGEKRGVGTQLIAEWYLTPFAHWIVDPAPSTLAIATLQYALCGNTATIVDFKRLDGSDHPAPHPTTADNTLFKHRGLAGDKVLLAWSSIPNAADDPTGWIVINVTGHDYDVYVGMRRTGDCQQFCLEADVIQARLEVCSTDLSHVIFCYPCNDSSLQTSIEQTSFGQTSNLQTSTVGCGEGVINPDIMLSGQLRIADSIGAVQNRLVSVTITNQTGCEGGLGPVQNPRSNNVYQPFTSPSGYWGIVTNQSGWNPDEPASYQQGAFETYTLRCAQRIDPISGITLNPDDPNDVEWIMEGSFSNPTLGLGATGGSEIRITETGGGAWSELTASPWTSMPGTLQILSLNPFHAQAIFTPPGWYPDAFINQNCGPVMVEFVELP